MNLAVVVLPLLASACTPSVPEPAMEKAKRHYGSLLAANPALTVPATSKEPPA